MTTDPLYITLTHNGWFADYGFNSYGSGVWFLDVLLLCYVIWYILNSKFSGKYQISIIVMIGIGLVCNLNSFSIPFMYEANGRAYTAFFIGSLLYEIFERIDNKKAERIAKVMAVLMMFLIVLITLIALGIFPEYLLFDRFQVIFSLFISPAIIWISIFWNPIESFLSSKIFNICAKYTMAIYLTHCLVFWSLRIINYLCGYKIIFGQVKIMFVVLLIVFIIGVITQKTYEFISNKNMK